MGLSGGLANNGGAGLPASVVNGSSDTLITAKGDLTPGSANATRVRLAVGADGTVLTADAASAGGVKWSAGGVTSPINLVTVAASPAIANKLLAGDANNAWEIDGNGKIRAGSGGASALSLSITPTPSSGGWVLSDGTASVYIGNIGGGRAGFDIGNSSDTQLYRKSSGLLAYFGTLANDKAANETTTATAGTNGAVPAQVVGYLTVVDSGGTNRKIPYFAV